MWWCWTMKDQKLQHGFPFHPFPKNVEKKLYLYHDHPRYLNDLPEMGGIATIPSGFVAVWHNSFWDSRDSSLQDHLASAVTHQSKGLQHIRQTWRIGTTVPKCSKCFHKASPCEAANTSRSGYLAKTVCIFQPRCIKIVSRTGSLPRLRSDERQDFGRRFASLIALGGTQLFSRFSRFPIADAASTWLLTTWFCTASAAENSPHIQCWVNSYQFCSVLQFPKKIHLKKSQKTTNSTTHLWGNALPASNKSSDLQRTEENA